MQHTVISRRTLLHATGLIATGFLNGCGGSGSNDSDSTPVGAESMYPERNYPEVYRVADTIPQPYPSEVQYLSWYRAWTPFDDGEIVETVFASPSGMVYYATSPASSPGATYRASVRVFDASRVQQRRVVLSPASGYTEVLSQMFVDSEGNIYRLDKKNRAVHRFAPDGTYLNSPVSAGGVLSAPTKNPLFFADNGDVTFLENASQQYGQPRRLLTHSREGELVGQRMVPNLGYCVGLRFDGSGNLYIGTVRDEIFVGGDIMPYKIQKLTPSGEERTYFVTQNIGQSSEADFSVDADGNVYTHFQQDTTVYKRLA